MASRKLPYFSWYAADAEADGDWIMMDLAERGLFITMLNFSWINSGLPIESADLARIARVDEILFKKLWVKVGKKFTLRDGRLINKRQEEERESIKIRSEKAAESAREMHSQRKLKAHAEVMRTQSERSARASDSDSCSKSCSDSEDLDTSQVENLSTRADAENGSSETPAKPSVDSPGMRWIETPVERVSNDARLTWAEEIYFRHPKQANKHASILALCRLYDVPGDRALFECHYDAWIECWAREGAKFTPPLVKPDGSGFLPDGAWRKPPPRPPKVEEKVSESLRALRAVKV